MPKTLNGKATAGIMLKGLSEQTGRYTNNSGSADIVVTIETHMVTIFSEYGKLTDATATLVATIGNSTTYPGTKTVAYTVPNAKTLQYLIKGTQGDYDDTATGGSSVTIDTDSVY